VTSPIGKPASSIRDAPVTRAFRAPSTPPSGAAPGSPSTWCQFSTDNSWPSTSRSAISGDVGCPGRSWGFGANPYVTASELAEQWCQARSARSLPLMSCRSKPRTAAGSWRSSSARISRSSLVHPQTYGFTPATRRCRRHRTVAPGDLERWLTPRPSSAPLPRHESGGTPLLF